MDFYSAQSQLLDPMNAGFVTDQERAQARRNFNAGLTAAIAVGVFVIAATLGGPFVVNFLTHFGH